MLPSMIWNANFRHTAQHISGDCSAAIYGLGQELLPCGTAYSRRLQCCHLWTGTGTTAMRHSVFQAVAVLPSMDWDRNYCHAAQGISGGCGAVIYGLGQERLPCGTADFRRLQCCHLRTGTGTPAMRHSIFQAIAVLPSMDWDRKYCHAAQHISGDCSAAIYGLGQELLPCGTAYFRQLQCCYLWTGRGTTAMRHSRFQAFAVLPSTEWDRSYCHAAQHVRRLQCCHLWTGTGTTAMRHSVFQAVAVLPSMDWDRNYCHAAQRISGGCSAGIYRLGQELLPCGAAYFRRLQCCHLWTGTRTTAMRHSIFQAIAVLPSIDGEELLPCGTTDFRRLHCCHLYTGIGSILLCGTASMAFSRSYRSLIMWDAG